MPHRSVLRTEATIRRELAFILDRNLQDPRIGMVTVTKVELSVDSRYAKVYVSFLGDDDEKQKSLHLLRKARRFVRGELAHSLRLRVAPELTFLIDESSENYIHIANVLKKIEEKDAEGSAEGAAELSADGAEEAGDAEADEGSDDSERQS